MQAATGPDPLKAALRLTDRPQKRRRVARGHKRLPGGAPVEADLGFRSLPTTSGLRVPRNFSSSSSSSTEPRPSRNKTPNRAQWRGAPGVLSAKRPQLQPLPALPPTCYLRERERERWTGAARKRFWEMKFCRTFGQGSASRDPPAPEREKRRLRFPSSPPIGLCRCYSRCQAGLPFSG